MPSLQFYAPVLTDPPSSFRNFMHAFRFTQSLAQSLHVSYYSLSPLRVGALSCPPLLCPIGPLYACPSTRFPAQPLTVVQVTTQRAPSVAIRSISVFFCRFIARTQTLLSFGIAEAAKLLLLPPSLHLCYPQDRYFSRTFYQWWLATTTEARERQRYGRANVIRARAP